MTGARAATAVGAVILAAGRAARFGGPKQLAQDRGQPLLAHVLASCADLDDVVLVVGARADEVLAGVAPGRARVVRCTDWEEGMAASLRAGLAALDADWSVVLLADQPRIGAAAVARVAAAARAAPFGVQAVRGAYAGRPGHPVALSRRLAAAAGVLWAIAVAVATEHLAAAHVVVAVSASDRVTVGGPILLLLHGAPLR